MNGETMFKRLVWASVLVGWSSFGCDLRVQPMLPDGGVGVGGTGTGGSIAAGGRGGVTGAGGVVAAGGRGGSISGIGGTGGSVAGSSAGGSTGAGGVGGSSNAGGRGGSSNAGTTGNDAGSDAPTCTGGGVCTPTNPCHVGQTVCSASGVASCMDTQATQAN